MQGSYSSISRRFHHNRSRLVAFENRNVNKGGENFVPPNLRGRSGGALVDALGVH